MAIIIGRPGNPNRYEFNPSDSSDTSNKPGSSSSSNVPDQIQVGTNPQNDEPIFVQSQASKEKDLAEKKAAILAMAGNANSYSPSPSTSGIDRDKIINLHHLSDEHLRILSRSVAKENEKRQ